MRTQLCLKAFNNYQPIVTVTFPIDYYNQYYQKRLDYTVADFFWASSRKSYLPCGQVYDVYSYDAIVGCLKAGARVLQLDIYSDQLSNPVIRDAHPMPVYGTPLEFLKVLQLINRYAWLNNRDYPLVLIFNIHTNNRTTFQKIATQLSTVFKDKFPNKKYSYAGRDGAFPFGKIPIRELLGKIAILVDKYPLIENLNELVVGEINGERNEIVVKPYTASMEQYGGLSSTSVDLKALTDFNKFSITIVDSEGTAGKLEDDNILRTVFTQNVRNPKSDLFNAPPADCWKYGCQIVLMNYQLFDEKMKTYSQTFAKAKGGLILKPANLRYIPQPPPKLVAQNKEASYAPETIEQKGWYKFDI